MKFDVEEIKLDAMWELLAITKNDFQNHLQKWMDLEGYCFEKRLH